mmetsp:Transcript_104160/g.224849  ORF Transcript_104160/g.224849 Transcript_104160/m.224849 type:complete len:207 (+) Transcript_104160:1355-1975(+)
MLFVASTQADRSSMTSLHTRPLTAAARATSASWRERTSRSVALKPTTCAGMPAQSRQPEGHAMGAMLRCSGLNEQVQEASAMQSSGHWPVATQTNSRSTTGERCSGVQERASTSSRRSSNLPKSSGGVGLRPQWAGFPAPAPGGPASDSAQARARARGRDGRMPRLFIVVLARREDGGPRREARGATRPWPPAAPATRGAPGCGRS